jgi:hypothetical protein
MTKQSAHIRHMGIMIDASFNKDGSIAFYVVEGGFGRFYSLNVAKEIAEGRARAKA